MKTVIVIIKYALIVTILLGAFKIGHSLITQEKKFTFENIIKETKGLISGGRNKITGTEEKLLYKDVIFSITETERDKFELRIETKKTFPGCGFEILNTVTEKPFKISVHLDEIKPPEKQLCQNSEKPATATVSITLDENIPIEISIVRSLLVDKYSIEIRKDVILVNPAKGAFSESTSKEFTRF